MSKVSKGKVLNPNTGRYVKKGGRVHKELISVSFSMYKPKLIDLPDEILGVVNKLLNPRDLKTLSQINRHFNRLVNDEIRHRKRDMLLSVRGTHCCEIICRVERLDMFGEVTPNRTQDEIDEDTNSIIDILSGFGSMVNGDRANVLVTYVGEGIFYCVVGFDVRYIYHDDGGHMYYDPDEPQEVELGNVIPVHRMGGVRSIITITQISLIR